jgi:hypothetical protein
MFIGHYAVGLAAKPVAPRLSLGVLVLAGAFLDIVFVLLLAARIEHLSIEPGITRVSPFNLYDYPWSHSLVLSLLWSAAFAAVVYAVIRDARAAWVVALLVFSHWVLDIVTHRPDMQLWPGSGARLGLGLWDSVVGTAVVEGGLFLLGAAVYLRFTRARDRVGRWATWLLLALLFALWANSLSGAPPPPSVRAMVLVSGALSVVVLAWFTWMDAHREPRPPG